MAAESPPFWPAPAGLGAVAGPLIVAGSAALLRTPFMSKLDSSVAVAKRDAFSSSFGVLAATLGSAVGLGNIWKFPYLTGANGGAGFLLVYVLATLLVGLPVMIAEIMLGRKAKTDTVGTFKQLAPGTPWWLIGGFGVLAAFLIMAY
jgi:NSS family neurotransmitter:Na+ symporter